MHQDLTITGETVNQNQLGDLSQNIDTDPFSVNVEPEVSTFRGSVHIDVTDNRGREGAE